jgi:hypothetical protein
VTLNRGEKVVHTAIMPAAPVEKPVEPQPPEGGDKPAAAQGGDHTLAWVALGVGGALVATGGVFTYLAYDRFGDYDANRDTADEMLEDGDDPDDIAEWINDEDDKVAADVSQDQWIFVTCYAVGGAAVAAGVVMLLLDDGAGTDGPAVSVVPLLSPETTGLSFSASF